MMNSILILSILSIASGLQQNVTVEDTSIEHTSEIILEHKCEQITVPFCMGIPYNETFMPNVLGHSSQEEAGLAVQQYFPFVRNVCSPHLRLFLCSVYFPVCTIVDRPIPPCPSLCLLAKNGCEKVMMQYGFKWPDNLNCDKYPGKMNLCVHESNTANNTANDAIDDDDKA